MVKKTRRPDPAPAPGGPIPPGRAAHDPLVWRVRGEFLEIPGLCVTAAQARLLFGLTHAQCDHVLGRLEASGFLRRAAGQFRRAGCV